MSTITHHVRRPARESTAERRQLVAVPPAADPADELRTAVEWAIAESRSAREDAERALGRAEVVRVRAATALEHDLRPMRIDEATRAALRATYAEADADVAAKRREVERARDLETATLRVCASVSGDGGDAARAVLLAALRAGA